MKGSDFVVKQELDRDIKSLICIPLLVERKSIGVLNMVNKKTVGKFTADDLSLALTLANQASVLIQNARLYNLATVDGLTGLFVRRHFQYKLSEELSRAKRYDKPMAVMMSDIDHFKKFNDTYGHQTGDLVLREVASLLKDSIRNLDTAARFGGEEFVVVLPETDNEGAFTLAERYRKKIEEFDFVDGDNILKVTISIGVATIEGANPQNEKDFVEKADIALYNCKNSGRNCVTLYHPDLLEKDILK
ncbi:diguanylate cyclase [Candidatus Riflebacteria bacterium]